MSSPPLTLMAVHAHPDDEATSTGGVLARYASEGVRTVLVTCTDGRCGDGPGGAKPGEAGHDPMAVAASREAELRRSCEILGVSHLELLGFADSGMMGWSTNEAPGSFWRTDPVLAAGALAQVMERYRPQVVVTYDANGFYGHPDHIMANRITTLAIERTGVAEKLYHTAIGRARVAEFADAVRAAGIDPPALTDREEGRYLGSGSDTDAAAGSDVAVGRPGTHPVSPVGPGAAPSEGSTARQPGGVEVSEDVTAPTQEEPAFGTPDEEITTNVAVGAWVELKRAALAAHSSQADNLFFLRLGADLYRRLFGVESFVRVLDRTGAPLPEEDLFAGLR